VGKEVERIERAFERLEAAVHAARLIAAGEAR
jgi:hypothetical protein